MNFMISSRHPLTILKDASEIRVDYEDRERIKDFISQKETFQSEINIYISNNTIIDWDFLEKYAKVLKIVLAVENTSLIKLCKQKNFKCFWSFPVTSYWELNGLLKLGINEVLLDAPLYFDLENVKNICGDNVEIRLVVNKCYNNYMERENGIEGTYIRPEDLELYSQYVQHIEFDSDNNLEQELTLLKVYSQQKFWPGNLNLLLKNLKVDIDNRGLSFIDFGQKRMNCGQKCQIKKCEYCKKVFSLMNNIDKNSQAIIKRIEEYYEKNNLNKENNN